MKLNYRRATFYHLLIVRWLTLLNVVVLIAFREYGYSLLIFFGIIFYCLLLSKFWNLIIRHIERQPVWLLTDATISGVVIGITGGGWTSPYALYGLTSILIVSLFSSVKGALLFTLYLVFLYTVGLLINMDNILKIKLLDLNLLLTTYIVAFISAICFGYPVQIIRKIEKVKENTAYAKKELSKTKEIIAKIAANAKPLTCRELEVLNVLSQGKSNRQIAEEFHISERTVSTHLYRIYKKMGISSREEAVFIFLGNHEGNSED